MTRKKIGLLAVPLIAAVAIVGVMNTDDTAVKTSSTNEIPFHQVTKTEEPTTRFTVDAAGNVSSVDASSEIVAVDPVSDETAAPAVPQTLFSASSAQYPGPGTFDLPVFATPGEWAVDFSYTCDTGKVFLNVYVGNSTVSPGSFPAGPFVGTRGHLKVVVPAEADATNCSWQVSVS